MTTPQPPPERSKYVDYKYVIGLAIAGVLAYWQAQVANEKRVAGIEAKLVIAPELRNREIDDLNRRLASIEQYVRDNCGKSNGR